MNNSNTDYVVTLIVDSIINSMKSQLEGKVPDTVFDKVRSGAVLTASAAIPFPIQIAINAVPPSAYKVAGNITMSGAKAVAGTEAASVAKEAAAEGAKAIGAAATRGFRTVTSFLKSRKSEHDTNSVCEE